MAKKATKYIFVTGGVLSGLGKGITAASIANILKARGLKVNLQKCDPYLNVDAGTLNPGEHGECFVTKDGAETDLDLGHYERFLNQELTQSSSLMSGRILDQMIRDERNGRYLGSTVQFVPHVTKAIQEEIRKASEGFDVHIVEIGGTVGDYESLSFLEGIREFGLREGKGNCLYVHLVYMPYLGASHEFKTKPAQNAIRDLRGFGIVPDVIVVRSEEVAPENTIRKISLFSGVSTEAIVLLPNASSIYEVPLTLEASGIAKVISTQLGLKVSRPDLKEWSALVRSTKTDYKKSITIGIIAKYMTNQDTYMSVFEALKAAAWAQKVNIKIVWIDAVAIEKAKDTKDLSRFIKDCDGIVVPGGFGNRGIEGKILAAQYAIEHKLPYLGLCLGLQMAVVAYARNAGLKDANSTEFDPKTKNPVIATMKEQKGKENTGGSMRLGNYLCVLEKGSLARKLYRQGSVQERHRHRYECNSKYVKKYDSWGVKAVGINPETKLVEVIEGIDHPFLVASQFHPEFKSRPNQPHPLFSGLISAAIKTAK